MLQIIKGFKIGLVSKLFAGLILALMTVRGVAQDVQISQYYAVPLFLNPAMTGLGNDTRVGLDYRNQWARIGKAYTSQIIFGDHYFSEQKISAGAVIMNQVEGYGKLRTTNFNALGAYTIDLGENFAINAGLQGTYAFRGIDYSLLDFGDQYTNDGFIDGSTTAETFAGNSAGYWDVGAGMLLYGKRMFLGASMHHIPKPDISLSATKDRLDRKFSVQGGFKVPLQQPTRTFTPTTEQSILGIFNYKSQGIYSQFDIGSYLIYEPVMFGLWYRGLPIGKTEGSESIVALAGIYVQNFTFAYSYDITLSNLRGNNLSTHEISLTYEFIMYQRSRLVVRKGPKMRKDLPCAKFLR